MTGLSVDEENALAAITETIRTCGDENILKDFLEDNESEIIDEEPDIFPYGKILKVFLEDIKQRNEEPVRRAERDKDVSIAATLLKTGKFSLEDIYEGTGLSLDEIEELGRTLNQPS